MTSYVKNFTQGVAHLRAHDPRLAAYIQQAPSPIIIPHTEYYKALVNSIIGQQLSVKAAAAIQRRFLELFSGVFPSPELLLLQDDATLKSSGLSRPKVTYIKDLAQRIIDGRIEFTHFDVMSDQEIMTALLPVKGIGEWTVHMFLLFCMGRLDVLPVGDLGIRHACQRIYGLQSLPTPAEVTELAAKNQWHPYCSVVSLYLWQALDNSSAWLN